MQRTLLNVKELAQRWNTSEPTIRRMESEHKIKRVANISGVKFSLDDVLKIENNGQADVLSPLERRRLELEIKSKEAEIERLNSILSQIFTVASGYAVERISQWM